MPDQDMPKLQCLWKRKLDSEGHYIVSDVLDLDYQWVLEDPTVIPVEKLDGTNCSCVIENGQIVRAYNRMNPIPINSNHRLWEGFANALKHPLIKDYMESLPDGQHFGELIGPGIQSNSMNLKEKLFIPFNSFGRDKLNYTDQWQSIKHDYDTIRTWMKDNVRSRMFTLLHCTNEDIIPEGLVFHRPSTGEMSKLRSDMYDFWYEDPTHRPHKFMEEKVHKPKAPSPMAEEISALKKREEQGLISHEDFITQRNLVLNKYGIVPK